MERLKEEVENNKDELLEYLLDRESKISKLLTGLEYEKTWVSQSEPSTKHYSLKMLGLNI